VKHRGSPAQKRLWARTQELDYNTPCQMAPDDWDPPGGKEGPELAYARIRSALAGCDSCAVRSECLALLNEQKENCITVRGVWAGTVEYDPMYPVLNARVRVLMEKR
jgi:hypothetical protein